MKHVSLHNGTTLEWREQLAAKVFAHTSQYDAAILRALGAKPLRYGENPHQSARLCLTHPETLDLAGVQPIQGKELSYNNLLDADAAIFALRCLMEDRDPGLYGAVIIKHNTPCGAALHADQDQAFAKAVNSDPTSAFGGIVAFSHEVEEKLAQACAEMFLEMIIAPSFNESARACLARKKDLRLIEISSLMKAPLPKYEQRSVMGGMLIQDQDRPFTQIRSSEVVTNRCPTPAEWQALDLAFRMCIPTRSNAIVLTNASQVIGVGAGQTSRVDAVEIAIRKAKTFKHELEGAALGSDAFFPFADGIELAARAGIQCIAQPGGSKRDAEVIQTANAHNMTMVFTKQRHFRH